MEFINKLEATVGGWLKNVPHLPPAGQKWLGQNIWWIALVGAIASGIAVFIALTGILFGGISASFVYVIDPALAAWILIVSIVNLVFTAARGLLLALAVTPLKAMQKKGWVLLFYSWLLHVLSVVVGAVLSLSAFGFIGGILFGSIGVLISGYFLYEIHAQFAHVKTTKTVKN